MSKSSSSSSSSFSSSSLSAATQARLNQELDKCKSILDGISSHKDAAAFLTPVPWEEWGLRDYPKVIKHPMDLGTVKEKFARGEYKHPKEFKHDVNLVWHNCMTYNVEGSDYYLQAAKLKAIFEERYNKIIGRAADDDDAAQASLAEKGGPQAQVRRPSLMDKKMFSQNLYNISSEDLGRVVHLLDERCEACIKKIDPEDIEIEIDAIDDATFWIVDVFVKSCLPGGKKSSGGAAGGPAAAASGASSSSSSSSSSSASSQAAVGPSQPKKARKE